MIGYTDDVSKRLKKLNRSYYQH
ncbi:hypothetical protein [Mycoplasmoides gallisepticum]